MQSVTADIVVNFKLIKISADGEELSDDRPR